jgi:hypothetical protein
LIGTRHILVLDNFAEDFPKHQKRQNQMMNNESLQCAISLDETNFLPQPDNKKIDISIHQMKFKSTKALM